MTWKPRSGEGYGALGVIAVDTNVVVRLLARDDEAQYQASRTLFETQEIFIPNTVVLELEWVLRYAYDFSPAEIGAAFKRLFGLKNVHLDHPQRVAEAISWHETGLDFADAFHLAQSQQCSTFKTFDERLIKRAPLQSQCTVEKP